MIKFFRHIRQNLVMENKTGKYFKYAIGEIILVVIGILIALQINNWNQERINNQRAEGYLKSLAEDLKSDIVQYDYNIENYEQDLDNNKRLFINDDFKKLEADSIFKLVRGYYQLNRVSTHTYERIKNAGLIESLGTEKINKALNNYYNIQLSYYEGLLQWDKNSSVKDEDFWTYNNNFESGSIRYYGTNSLPFKDSPAKRKNDLVNLIESTQGRNHLRNAIVRHEHTLFRVNELKATTQHLLDLINIEINN